VPQVSGAPRTGSCPWGGDLDFQTWDTTIFVKSRARRFQPQPSENTPQINFVKFADHFRLPAHTGFMIAKQITISSLVPWSLHQK
jgi:hypothetical protein